MYTYRAHVIGARFPYIFYSPKQEFIESKCVPSCSHLNDCKVYLHTIQRKRWQATVSVRTSTSLRCLMGKNLAWKGAFASIDLHGSRSDTVHSGVSKENQQAFKAEFAMISTWKALKLFCKLFSCQLCRLRCSLAWRWKLSRHQDNCLENCFVSMKGLSKLEGSFQSYFSRRQLCWKVNKCIRIVYFQRYQLYDLFDETSSAVKLQLELNSCAFMFIEWNSENTWRMLSWKLSYVTSHAKNLNLDSYTMRKL